MNSGKTKSQKRKMSLKPYVYPRCYEISETFEKEMISKIQYFNSNLRESRRHTLAETFRDFEDQGQDQNQSSKQYKFEDENKTRLSLFSRINKLKSFISDRSKPNSITEKISAEADQAFISKSLICSHNSQNSYLRLKKLYQTELKSCAQSLDRSQDFNQANHLKPSVQSKKRASLQLMDSTNFHNCSINENQPQENTGADGCYDQNKSSRASSFQRANSTRKKQTTSTTRNQTNKLNFSLFTKLQQLKHKKKDQRLSFMVFADYQYF
ncbi:unnamed protein product (macronuclear) [Paramecium tetraurelia]|uniref:Uncharacterized protein n=1 Tax=Paramecium tetraurelia TaxID=5888 RepID=A0E3K6_PARTE|nr:uncharacterized protein GSPATT00023046001 [Paramecium tetraurelia]CAK89873.1 unnamed protein product [Paramecium tetraurelia]|eukprot:XP_001457270.1 hypothetical protein (macronuclear) [Paramecium tetraurelia strain d4-2]